jgi:hypothetical protein
VKFQYLIVESRLFDRKAESLEKEMNQLGSEGWEMVAACGAHNQTFVFMRALSEGRRGKPEMSPD